MNQLKVETALGILRLGRGVISTKRKVDPGGRAVEPCGQAVFGDRRFSSKGATITHEAVAFHWSSGPPLAVAVSGQRPLVSALVVVADEEIANSSIRASSAARHTANRTSSHRIFLAVIAAQNRRDGLLRQLRIKYYLKGLSPFSS